MKISIIGGARRQVLLRRIAGEHDITAGEHDITVWEGNARDDTFSLGVVFSDETLRAFEAADPSTYAWIAESFAGWSEIDGQSRSVVEWSVDIASWRWADAFVADPP